MPVVNPGSHSSTRCSGMTIVARGRTRSFFCRMGKHRTHILFCDTVLSTATTVHLNVYQNFLLTAMKMHLYLRDLAGGAPDSRFIYCAYDLIDSVLLKSPDAISQTIRFTQVATRHTTLHRLAKKHDASCSISRNSVYWYALGVYASAFSDAISGSDGTHSLPSWSESAHRTLEHYLSYERNATLRDTSVTKRSSSRSSSEGGNPSRA